MSFETSRKLGYLLLLLLVFIPVPLLIYSGLDTSEAVVSGVFLGWVIGWPITHIASVWLLRRSYFPCSCGSRASYQKARWSWACTFDYFTHVFRCSKCNHTREWEEGGLV